MVCVGEWCVRLRFLFLAFSVVSQFFFELPLCYVCVLRVSQSKGMMRGMMEDLLSGWSVNDRKMSSFVAASGRMTPDNETKPKSSDGFFTPSTGRPIVSASRQYGWCPSLKVTTGDRSAGGAACLRDADSASRQQGLDRHMLPMYSPYLSKTIQHFPKRSPNCALSSVAKDVISHRRGVNALKPANRLNQLQCGAGCRYATSSRLEGGGVKTFKTTFPMRKGNVLSSRSVGGAFFECLATATFPASDERCMVNEEETTPLEAKKWVQEDSAGDGSLRHSSRGGDKKKVEQITETDCVNSVLEWEAICATERTATEECLLVKKELERLRVEIDEATNAIELLKANHSAVGKKLQSFLQLRSAVAREERESRKLQYLAKESRDRVNRLRSNQSSADITTAALNEAPCDGVDGEPSVAELLHQCSALQRERKVLKEAISAANNAAAAEKLAMRESTRFPFTGVSLSEERQLYAESKMLKRSIASMSSREERFNARAKKAEMHAAAVMERVNVLRLMVRLQEEQWRKKERREHTSLRDEQNHDKSALVEEHNRSCFITGVEL